MPSLFSLSLDSAHLKSLEQLSDRDYWEYARSLANVSPAQSADVGAADAGTWVEEYLECLLKQGRFFISLTAISEVISSPQRCTPLPATPVWMPGLVAWLGEAIAVIDLEAYLADTVHEEREGGFICPLGRILLMTPTDGVTLGLWVPGIGASTLGGEVGAMNSAPTSGAPTLGGEAEAMNGASTLGGEVEAMNSAPTWVAPGRRACVKGMSTGAWVLDVEALLTGIVQEIEVMASHG